MLTSKIRVTRKAHLLRAIALVGVMVVSGAAVLYVIRSRSVLYRFVESGDPAHEPGFSIFNPFRDRVPEKCGESFLRLMQAGKCEDAVSSMPVEGEHRLYICEKEREHPLMSWRLKNRTDQAAIVRMFYWHWSIAAKRHGRLWVTVAKTDEGWRVVDYERHY